MVDWQELISAVIAIAIGTGITFLFQPIGNLPGISTINAIGYIFLIGGCIFFLDSLFDAPLLNGLKQIK